MVGGTITKVVAERDPRMVGVRVEDSGDECSVRFRLPAGIEQTDIKVDDSVWWQGPYVMWRSLSEEDSPELKCRKVGGAGDFDLRTYYPDPEKVGG